MKKILLLAGVAFAAYQYFGKDDTMDAVTQSGSLEGIIVVLPNGQVYVVRNSKLYAVTSEEAAFDYKAAYPQFATSLSVSDEMVSQYPVVGALYPDVVFMND